MARVMLACFIDKACVEHRIEEITRKSAPRVSSTRESDDFKEAGIISGNAEQERLQAAKNNDVPWRKWGPYLSERQWGTVREDYSENGDRYFDVFVEYAKAGPDDILVKPLKFIPAKF